MQAPASERHIGGQLQYSLSPGPWTPLQPCRSQVDGPSLHLDQPHIRYRLILMHLLHTCLWEAPSAQLSKSIPYRVAWSDGSQHTVVFQHYHHPHRRLNTRLLRRECHFLAMMELPQQSVRPWVIHGYHCLLEMHITSSPQFAFLQSTRLPPVRLRLPTTFIA